MGKLINLTEKTSIAELEETIRLKDREIEEIKNSMIDVLNEIRCINESNNYSDVTEKQRNISERCTNTIYELMNDLWEE